ncbi:hypothetical protein GCM10028807_41730 [Spirosoma daeguense]
MKTLLTSLFFLWFMTPKWELNFDQAKTEASQNHKFILLNFSGSDWCAPCIKMKRDIFESNEFNQYAQNYLVLVRADFPRLAKNQLDAQQVAHNEALAEKYNRQGKFPFTVLLNADGKVLKEWDGYKPSLTTAAFVESIQSVVGPK